MKIKKRVFYGILGIISLSLGIFLCWVLLNALSKYGISGYLVFILFLITTILYISYELNIKSKNKIANEVVDQLYNEYSDKLDQAILEDTKTKLLKNLIDKTYNETWNLADIFKHK